MTAGDADAPLSPGDTDGAAAAGTAEKGIVLSLGEAVAPQGKPVEKPLLFLKIAQVFLLPAVNMPA